MTIPCQALKREGVTTILKGVVLGRDPSLRSAEHLTQMMI